MVKAEMTGNTQIKAALPGEVAHFFNVEIRLVLIATSTKVSPMITRKMMSPGSNDFMVNTPMGLNEMHSIMHPSVRIT
jgi:hypothetical protein